MLKTIKDLNQELVDKLSLEEYLDLFFTMVHTLSERSLYFAESRKH